VAATYEPLAITVNGPDVWIAFVDARRAVDAVSEFRSTNGSLVRLIDGPADDFNFNAPPSLASNATRVWVANIDSVTELDARNGSVVRVLRGGRDGLYGPQGIAVGGPHLWVSNWANQSVSELDATNGALVRVVR